jgi:hypothetical protein
MNIKDHDQVTRFAYTFNLVSAGLLSFPINLPGTAFSRAMKAGNSFVRSFWASLESEKWSSLRI